MIKIVSIILIIFFIPACKDCFADNASKLLEKTKVPIQAKNETKDTIREPAVSGKFYPANPKELSQMINGFLKNVKGEPKIEGEIVSLVVPHAGYIYSGQVAGYAYKILEGKKFDTVVLVGPSHHVPFEGVSVYNKGFFETPLGRVEINQKLADEIIAKNKNISFYPDAHKYEHSLEVQIPFLQSVLGDFKIVPIAMGTQTDEIVNTLGDALADTLKDKKNVLLIASSDLSHYRPAEKGEKMDKLGLEYVQKLDGDGLLKKLIEGATEFCGGGSVVAVIKAVKKLGANNAILLKYGDSGDITGDKSSVVGYASLAITKIASKIDVESVEEGISKKNQSRLLEIARKSIETYLKTGDEPTFEVNEPELIKNGASFITITKNGELRGCIGHVIAVMPLFQSVSENAISSAVRDPRFPPLKIDELALVKLEISVLTPLQEINDISRIVVGKHGIVMSKGFYRGLLLPQVATEYDWDRGTFLNQTCHKAGMNEECWKEGAKIEIFSAQVFHE